MGMPTSTFAVFDAMAQRSDDPIVQAVRRDLDPFVLFCFVLHDPVRHVEFDETLNSRFDSLDRLTGGDLLFFALVDPPEDWRAIASRRSYYGTLSRIERPLGRSHGDLERAGRATYALARKLSIPEAELPCLLVTNDLRGNDFVRFRTCPQYLEKQLDDLGGYASRHTELRVESRYDRYRTVRLSDVMPAERFDLCGGHQVTVLAQNLAAAIADVLSFLQSDLRGMDGHFAAQRQRGLIDHFSRLIETVRDDEGGGPEEQVARVEEVALDALFLLALLHPDPTLSRDIKLPLEVLEPDVARVLETAFIVDDIIGNYGHLIEPYGGYPHHGGFPRAWDRRAMDYTVTVMGLAKAFEMETNLSLVQWARKLTGIDLPEYFNKYQPRVQARVALDHGRPVDMNRQNRGEWLPPGLGGARLACEALSRTSLPPEWEEEGWAKLLSTWDTIRIHRNHAAHRGIVEAADASAVKAAFGQLAEIQAFEHMYNLKTIYRGAV